MAANTQPKPGPEKAAATPRRPRKRAEAAAPAEDAAVALAGRVGAFDRKAQFNQRKDALLEEAIRLFNKRGYANVSLEDVAKNLNISKAAVYYYFPSKQEILYECYWKSFDIWSEALAEAIKKGKTPREQIEIYLKRYLETGLDELQPIMTVREQDLLSPQNWKKIERRRRALRDKLRQIVAEGMADGSFEKADPKLLVTIMSGSISWVLRMYRPGGTMPKEAFAEQTARFVIKGFLKSAD